MVFLNLLCLMLVALIPLLTMLLASQLLGRGAGARVAAAAYGMTMTAICLLLTLIGSRAADREHPLAESRTSYHTRRAGRRSLTGPIVYLITTAVSVASASAALRPRPGPGAHGEPEEQWMPVTAIREQSVSCLLDRDPTEVRCAREQTRKALSGWGLSEHTAVAELIVREYVTNALAHGEGPIKVRISCDGEYLRLEVHDDGAGRPARRQATATAASGRGLEVVDGLLGPQGGWRTLRGDDAGAGKTVGAVIRLAGDR